VKTVQALAVLVACAALSRTHGAAAPGPRSQDDRGFSIALVSPTDIYLTGRRTMRIETIIPRGDSIEQVDFFVDGRLAYIDVREPYAHEADFGDDIRRHTIEVRALSRQGRRAKVSMVSRSADLTEGAVGRVETLAAMVRNAAGRPVDGLTVSDFLLREDGARQPIVHFEGGGSPSSLALVMATGDALPLPDVNNSLADFLRSLPRHHAALVVEDTPAPEKPGEGVFSYDLGAVADRLQAGGEPTSIPAGALPDRLARAAAALDTRRGTRVLIVMAVREQPAPPDSIPAGPAGTMPAEPPTPEPPTPDPLDQALEAARQAGAVLYFVVLGPTEAPGHTGRLAGAADESGGRSLPAADLPALGQALATVAEALRHRYLISYMPVDPERAGRRRLEVSVLADGHSVEAPRSLALP